MSYIQMARRIWRRGEPLPVDLAMRLHALGYDVAAMEEKYLHSYSSDYGSGFSFVGSGEEFVED